MKELLIKATLVFYYPLMAIYWVIVKRISMIWGKYGIHAISIGEFLSGEQKVRSLYREDMLIKSLLLLVDFREKSCLDLACNDGFWSLRFGRFGINRLVGIDLHNRNIVRANFLKTVYNFPSFKFKSRDIFQYLYDENNENFDIIFLLSIIYHLPDETDWNQFFSSIYAINNECLVIDTRWFDNNEYFNDNTQERTMVKTDHGLKRKWRPKRIDVYTYLYSSGYESVIEVNPSAFLRDQREAYGDGNPYSLENVSDYITNNRSIFIAYKRKLMIPDIEKRLKIKYLKTV